ncbi:MAG: hypothetical protein RL069_375 [Planctomycetota bacterium]
MNGRLSLKALNTGLIKGWEKTDTFPTRLASVNSRLRGRYLNSAGRELLDYGQIVSFCRRLVAKVAV